jgi:hypothetical protein
MKKILNNNKSIEEEKKAKLDLIIEEISKSKMKKTDLLIPFVAGIKKMIDKKLSVNIQLKALEKIGITISVKTYRNFLIDNLGKKMILLMPNLNRK